MAEMTPQELQRRVDAFPFWYHRIALPGGVVTPGRSPLNVKTYGIPEDLSGKRVLDVGAWDGFWSFEALRRGARAVVAIDDFSDFLGQLDREDRRAWEERKWQRRMSPSGSISAARSPSRGGRS